MSAAQEMPDQAAGLGNALALLDRPLTAPLVFAPGGVTSLLQQIITQVRATEVDISTPAGRTACKRLAAKVARSKTTLDDMGKALNDEARTRIDSTDAERRTIRETLDGLKADVLAPLKEFEAREDRRVQAHQDALVAIPESADFFAEEPIDGLERRLAWLRAFPARDWEEFARPAANVIAREITLTTVALEAAQQREAEAARIAAEQEAAAEEARLEAERLRVEREARIAAEAAETARIAAEQEAEDRRLAALAAERARVEAVEAEHRRQTEAAAQAERDRAEAVAAEHARQVEAAEQVRRVADRERLAADQRAQRAEQERVSAEARAAEAVRRADADRAAAAERADQDRRAAVRAEQERVARVHEQEQAAAAAREADKTHKASRNNEVVADLMLVAGLGKDSAKAVVVALASRKIRHTTISY